MRKPALLTVAALALALVAASTGGWKKHRVQTFGIGTDGKSVVLTETFTYSASPATINEFLGQDVAPTQATMCFVWWPPYATQGAGCSGSCNGTGPMPAGQCCYSCPIDCGMYVFTATCPGAGKEAGGGQTCKGQRCTK